MDESEGGRAQVLGMMYSLFPTAGGCCAGCVWDHLVWLRGWVQSQ